MQLKKISILLLSVLLCQILKAQENESMTLIERSVLGKDNIIESQNEARILVTAARSERSADKLPVTLYVITHDEIIKNGCITLCDVLKNVPGIRVSQPHSGEMGEAFIQRGMKGNTYSKILLNGVEIRPSGLTGMPLGANIPIRQAEKIEIIYGPAAAYYGSDACGGVINIVTREADNQSLTSADLVIGSGQYSYLNFQTGGKFGHGRHVAQFSVYGSHLDYRDMNVFVDKTLLDPWNHFRQTEEPFKIVDQNGNNLELSADDVTPENFPLIMSQYQALYTFRINYNGEFNEAKLNKISQEATQLGAELKFHGFTLSYNMFHRMDYSSLGLTPMMYSYENPQTKMGEYIHRFSLLNALKVHRVQFNTSINYIHYRMDENSCQGTTYSVYPQYIYGASDDLIFDEYALWTPSKKFSLLLGGSFQYSGILPTTNAYKVKFDFDSYKMFSKNVDYEDPLFKNFGINPTVYNSTGVYLQSTYDVWRLSLTGGVRYDYNSIWGNSINPRIALLLTLTDNLTLRASRGYAYKAPSFEQMYGCVGVEVDAIPGDISYHHIPAGDNLKPERISANEIGLRYYFNKTNYSEIVWYTNRIKDPLARAWVDKPEIYSENRGAINAPGSPGNDYTRSYINEENSNTRLNGFQYIAFFQDIVKPIHLNIKGATTISLGYENLSNDEVENKSILKEKYIRQTPKYMFQLSFDMDLFKIIHFKADNIYCSKFSRKYYQGNDNEYYWAPSYYDLDLLLAIRINNRLSANLKIINTLNTAYGGIDVKEQDVDLQYNPQLGRCIRVGFSYDF